MPLSVLGSVYGGIYFDQRPGLCTALGSTCIVSCVVSLLSIGCISFSRYVYICHHPKYATVFTKRISIFMCVLVWVVGVLVDLPSHVGWSVHTFDNKAHKCIWDRNFRYSYTLFFCLGGVVVPLIAILVFYCRIFAFMGNAKKKLCGFSSNGGSRSYMPKVLKQARMMFVIFIAFALCWSPYLVVLVIDKDDRFPLQVHLYVSLVAHTHASVNFIIYGVANQKFRRRYKELIFRRLLCRNGTAFDHSVVTPFLRGHSVTPLKGEVDTVVRRKHENACNAKFNMSVFTIHKREIIIADSARVNKDHCTI